MTSKDKPLVTVYITTRNRYTLLDRAIHSVLKQTYKHIELIIADDDSTDNTYSVIQKFERQNIKLKYYKFSPSVGANNARNRCVLSAKGQFVTGLDDDDFYNDESRIEKFIKFWLETPEYPKKVLFDSVKVKTIFGNIRRKKKGFVTNLCLRTSNPIGSQIFAMRQTYIDCGLFDPKMPMWQDWDLFFRISKMGFVFINIQGFTYTVDKSHYYNRTSLLSDNLIRFSMNTFINNMYNSSDLEKTKILVVALSYKKIHFRYLDFIQLVKHKQFIFILTYPFIKLLHFLKLGK